MAAKKRKKKIIGSVLKNAETKAFYVKVYGDHVLRDGQFLNLETKQMQLDSVGKAEEAGKLSAEHAEAARERINKIPDFVVFEVNTLVSED